MGRLEKQFNQAKYIQEYNKSHYKTFKVDLKIEEWNELETLLIKSGKSKAQFLREAISKLKNSHNSHK